MAQSCISKVQLLRFTMMILYMYINIKGNLKISTIHKVSTQIARNSSLSTSPTAVTDNKIPRLGINIIINTMIQVCTHAVRDNGNHWALHIPL